MTSFLLHQLSVIINATKRLQIKFLFFSKIEMAHIKCCTRSGRRLCFSLFGVYRLQNREECWKDGWFNLLLITDATLIVLSQWKSIPSSFWASLIPWNLGNLSLWHLIIDFFSFCICELAFKQTKLKRSTPVCCIMILLHTPLAANLEAATLGWVII